MQFSMPITDVLYKVLFEGKDPKYGVHELMSRNKKNELLDRYFKHMKSMLISF